MIFASSDNRFKDYTKNKVLQCSGLFAKWLGWAKVR